MNLHWMSIALFLPAGFAYAQAGAESLTFEVASIKAADERPQGGMRVGCTGGPETKDPGRWSCENMSLANLISMAFELKRYQMSEQGDMNAHRYMVAAKIPEGTTKEQFRRMQQNLL